MISVSYLPPLHLRMHRAIGPLLNRTLSPPSGTDEAAAYVRPDLLQPLWAKLRATGPLADGVEALRVLDADTAEAAEQIVKGDPLVDAGIITSLRIRPIACRSVQEAKGGR